MTQDWTDRADPWLDARMRRKGQIEDAEHAILQAVASAMEEFLREAHAGVLGPRGMPLLDGYPDTHRWRELMDARVVPVLQDVWDGVYADAGGDLTAGARIDRITGKALRLREALISLVRDRLFSAVFPAAVFAAIQRELDTGINTGADEPLLRDRVAEVLRIDALSQSGRDRLAVLRARQADGTLSTDQKLELSALLDDAQDGKGTWQQQARRIARTEGVGVVNAAVYQAGDPSWTKRWVAIEDHSTREWHDDANGQEQPWLTPFMVDGEAMAYPGDPNGSGRNTVNCRCSLLHVA